MSVFLALLGIVMPVFLVVGAGYSTVRLNIFPDSAINALVRFATGIAVPCLLFMAMYRLRLGDAINPRLLVSFFGAATICFFGAKLISQFLWHRRPGVSVAVGFSALFSNSVLLGLPIIERAYGAQSLEWAFGIIAFHTPYCYSLGVITMEMTRRDGTSIGAALANAGRSLSRNPLIIGLVCGAACNIVGLRLPGFLEEALDMLVRAALPVALFGLGGVLTRYRLRDEISEACMVSGFSLIAHPLLAWVIASQIFGLPDEIVRVAVVIAAMPVGINGYLFASMYDRAIGTAASTVLISTMLSVITITLWLGWLGGAV